MIEAKFKEGDRVIYHERSVRGKVVAVVPPDHTVVGRLSYTYVIQTTFGMPLIVSEPYLTLLMSLVKPPITSAEGPILDSPPDDKGTPA